MKQDVVRPSGDTLRSQVQWGLLHVGLIWIYRGAPEGFGSGRQDIEQSPSAWYFLKGSGYVEADDGARTTAQAGQWLVARPVTRFQYFSGDAMILSIRFRAQWPDGKHLFDEGLSLSFDGKDHPGLLREAQALEKVVGRHTRNKFSNISLRDHPMGLETFLHIERQFLRWLAEFYRTLSAAGLRANQFEPGDRRVRRAIELLRGWPLERRYQVEELARSLGIGSRQLERLFIQSMGMTSKKYMDRRRFQFAQEHLEGEMWSIKEVAFRIGFSHVPSFCRWYRQYAGHSPSVRTVQ
jgi:AraC-like DNA-binding protein